MPTEKVIELSVEETNQLRAELGLAPLRMEAGEPTNDGSDASAATGDEEVLEMSVEETNSLREKLGLEPLRTSGSKKEVVHAPAENLGDRQKAAERIERAKLEREVQQGISKLESKSLGSDVTSAKSWAQQMRSKKATSKKTKKKQQSSKKEERYDETDLAGMNVGHDMSELQEGSTMVMTLADTSILETRDDTSKKVIGLSKGDGDQLENVNLTEERKQQDGLREKRKLELGMGRAGGYAGFDDDEFEELGGVQAASRKSRGGLLLGDDESSNRKRPRGFQIGAAQFDDEQGNQEQSDLFAGQDGKVISLETSRVDVAASDYMTLEEDEQARKKKKKEPKFKKKKKKHKSKSKRKQRQTVESDEEEAPPENASASKGLLDQLEETAVDSKSSKRRRRRSDKDDKATVPSKDAGGEDDMDVDHDGKQSEADKRAKFDAIMAKGNERTRQAFDAPKKTVAQDLEEEPDDAFLNAALAKARRLNRLREMSEKKTARGAEAVVEAVQSNNTTEPDEPKSSGTVAFSVDDTSEFARALRARTEQEERGQKTVKKDAEVQKYEVEVKPEPAASTDQQENDDMAELAKEVKEDEEILEGATGSAAPIGRGLAGVLNMLKQTGEMTRKNAGKEEMRGRAKDARTYEDYEAMDLAKVVQIDERTATEKDKELAQREVKLEYRDKHGRLLTRKEAFRELSHQFHGYGSGKRKEEKKLQQIAQEQAEARLASRQTAEAASAGTLGALKATQKATGKAFVVHKTS